MLDIKNTIKFENNCWVGEVDASQFNSSEENRILAVTDMASVTTGRLGHSFKDEDINNVQHYVSFIGKRRQAIYNRLLTESAGKPSVPFEFIPFHYGMESTSIATYDATEVFKHGFFHGAEFHTNYRTKLIQNLDEDKHPIHIDEEGNYDGDYYKDFKIIVGQIPIKVLSHLRTHRAFSFLVESSRNKNYLSEVQFHYPSWWDPNLMRYNLKKDHETIHDQLYQMRTWGKKPEEATMELSDRRLVYFAMCAWKTDLNSWDNLFAVRGPGTGTQSITGMTVDNIKTLVNGK